jgi:hypothetical protein
MITLRSLDAEGLARTEGALREALAGEGWEEVRGVA